jgi:hydrogenase-4 membrane subunit HyfE
MTNYFVAYVAAFFLPLLFHSWRVAVLGLGVQGFLLGLILAEHQHPWSLTLLLEYANLFVIHGLFVPWFLFRSMRGHDTPSDFTLISKNLVQWVLAFLLVMVAFVFGDTMAPDNSLEALQVGTATGAILIGVLVLSNQTHPLGQIVGLLMFEGGVTLVELLSPHAMPLPVYLGISLVFAVFVVTCGQYLIRLLAVPHGSEEAEHPREKVTL